MFRSIGRRSVSADHHILWLDRYSYIWPISCTDRNLMMSTRDDVYDAWGHMLQVNAGVEVLWCFEKQWKIRYMSCMFRMMIWWMVCSFLTADSVRGSAHHCTCLHGIRSWSRPLYEHLFIKQNIFFGHISLLNSINTGFTPFKLYLECHRFCHCNFPIRRTHTHTHTHTQMKSSAWWKKLFKKNLVNIA